MAPILSASASMAENRNEPNFKTTTHGHSVMTSRHIISLKKSFVTQDLPTPDVTGAVEKKVQNEDDALISAIISQDLKRSEAE